MPDLDLLVLCGGRGKRLESLTADTPKPLLPIGGRPFLWRLLHHYEGEGFRRFLLAAHYCHEQLEVFSVQHRARWPDLHVIVEPEPLGTGGAVRHSMAWVQSPTFVVVNGDSWVAQPLQPVVAEHRARRRTFTAVAVRASQVRGGVRDKGLWRVGPDGELQGFSTDSEATEGWVNAGIYVIERATAAQWPAGAYSLEAAFPHLLSGERAGIFRSDGTLLDIGTPACYAWVNQQGALTHEPR